ncbi:hypothetical protein ACS0TY_003396 [Phlomoides rotata]
MGSEATPEGCPNPAVVVIIRIVIVLGEVLRIRRLGTSPQWNYFQRNSCKLTIKVVQVGGCGLLLRWYILDSTKFI